MLSKQRSDWFSKPLCSGESAYGTGSDVKMRGKRKYKGNKQEVKIDSQISTSGFNQLATKHVSVTFFSLEPFSIPR